MMFSARIVCAEPRRLSLRIFLDEERDIDAGRAGGSAGRIETEITAIGLDQRFRTGQWRMQLAEISRDFFRAKPIGANVGHGRLSA
jgi:hypothetical protein